jgi:hypothetical protein
MSHPADSNAPADSHEIEHVKAHVRHHLVLGLVLAVLSTITVVIAVNPFNLVGNIAAALAIAAIEVGIVAGCFMELSKFRFVLFQAGLTLFFALIMIFLNLLGLFDHIHGTLLWP